LQLLSQMRPPEFELPLADRDGIDVVGRRSDLALIEAIPTPSRLFMNTSQVRGYGLRRRGRVAEANELGMANVAACLPVENRLCQQRLAPERHQTSAVEVLGVQCPEAHDLAPRAGRMLVAPACRRLGLALLQKTKDEQDDDRAKERDDERGEIEPANGVIHIENPAGKPTTHQRANDA